jgi:hypothetical protein
MLNIQLNANGGLVLGDGGCNGFAGSTLHQCHHAGGGINQQAAGANLGGGILTLHQSGNFSLHSNGDFHIISPLIFYLNIAEEGKYVNKGIEILDDWIYNKYINIERGVLL